MSHYGHVLTKCDANACRYWVQCANVLPSTSEGCDGNSGGVVSLQRHVAREPHAGGSWYISVIELLPHQRCCRLWALERGQAQWLARSHRRPGRHRRRRQVLGTSGQLFPDSGRARGIPTPSCGLNAWATRSDGIVGKQNSLDLCCSFRIRDSTVAPLLKTSCVSETRFSFSAQTRRHPTNDKSHSAAQGRPAPCVASRGSLSLRCCLCFLLKQRLVKLPVCMPLR